MSYSIEDLKGQVSQSGGMGAGNLYKVILPAIEGSGVRMAELDLLCTVASLPGRQIMSMDYMMGTTNRKIANGYAVTDMTLTFMVTNDHIARKYFESWQDLAHNPVTKELGFYNDYTKSVKIMHLQKGAAFPILKKQLNIAKRVPSFIRNRLPSIGPFDLSQGEFDLNASFSDTPVFTVELLECFPTSMAEIPLGNAVEGVMEFSVQLSFTSWVSSHTEPDSNLAASVVGFGIDKIRKLFG